MSFSLFRKQKDSIFPIKYSQKTTIVHISNDNKIKKRKPSTEKPPLRNARDVQNVCFSQQHPLTDTTALILKTVSLILCPLKKRQHYFKCLRNLPKATFLSYSGELVPEGLGHVRYDASIPGPDLAAGSAQESSSKCPRW